MAPGVEPVKVPGYHTDYTEGHSDEFRRLIPILFQRVIKRLILFSRKGGRYDGLPQIIYRRDGIACPSAH